MMDPRFYSRTQVDTESGCLLWTGHINRWGYGLFYVSSRIGQKLAHRVAYEAVYGEIPKGMVIRHKCDNPSCVNVDHLLIGSQTDNVADMDARCRRVPPFVPGVRNPNCKTTEDEVLAIRKEYLRGTSWDEMQTIFPINVGRLKKIATARQWRHLCGVNGHPALADLKAEARRRLWASQTGKKTNHHQ